MLDVSLQERYSPQGICFGCGPANALGLRIRSFAAGDGFVCDWTPEPHHQAFPGVLNGGVIGALLDCHSNWAAAIHLMRLSGEEHPPCTVTAEFAVKLRRPTPVDEAVHLSAHVREATENSALVEATLTAGGYVCATCTGTFVAVTPGHPAYHRW